MKRRTKRSYGSVITFLFLILLILFGIGTLKFALNALYPTDYSKYVEMYSAEYSLDEALVYSIIKAESGFNSKAESPRGAKGLMQIMDSTGEWAATKVKIEDFNNSMLFEPQTNIKIGCWYIARLLDMYNQNADMALAAYNAGSGNVAKWLKNKELSSNGKTLDRIPFEETKNYVSRVNKYKKMYKKIYDK